MAIKYNNNITAEDQIDAEELIASLIFDHPRNAIGNAEVTKLGKKILKVVLLRFRPDLFGTHNETTRKPRK